MNQVKLIGKFSIYGFLLVAALYHCKVLPIPVDSCADEEVHSKSASINVVEYNFDSKILISMLDVYMDSLNSVFACQKMSTVFLIDQTSSSRLAYGLYNGRGSFVTEEQILLKHQGLHVLMNKGFLLDTILFKEIVPVKSPGGVSLQIPLNDNCVGSDKFYLGYALFHINENFMYTPELESFKVVVD